MTQISQTSVARFVLSFIGAFACGLLVSQGLKFLFAAGPDLRAGVTMPVVAFCFYPFVRRSPEQSWLPLARYALVAIAMGVVWFLSLSALDRYFSD